MRMRTKQINQKINWKNENTKTKQNPTTWIKRKTKKIEKVHSH